VARQAFDDRWGTLHEGASADLVWLSADPRSTPALQIPAIAVRATYLRGKLR